MLFGYLIRKILFLNSYKRIQGKAGEESPGSDTDDEQRAIDVSKKLQKNLDSLRTMFGNSPDLTVHRFRFGPDNRLSGAMIYIDGMVNSLILTEAILRPLTDWRPQDGSLPSGMDLLAALEQEVLCSGEIAVVKTLQELAAGCLSGDTVLLVDGCPGGIVVNTKGWEKRNVTEPKSETVIRGPREGFTENLRTNTALIRRKIRNKQLRVIYMTVGRKTQTAVNLMYLEGVANLKVLETVKYRIDRLDVDSILESGYIEEYIEDAPFSPFSTVGYSEKPDVVAARILEGRVAIVVDGTPFVLTAPLLFIENFQTAEDYYERSLYVSMVRLLRYIAYLITIFAPAVFIILTVFHQELIPTTLLFTIANAREGTPFPAFVEAMIMVLAFELLREAGIRLPRPVGQAISIVGALIMGDAAVSAGLVGAPMVITVAVTAVAGFLVPTENDSASILRMIMMILAAFVGFYGVAMGFLAMLIHLATLESFGVPYFESIDSGRDMQDTFVRMPLWSMVKRPKALTHDDSTRHRFFVPPLRPYARQDDDSPEGEKQ